MSGIPLPCYLRGFRMSGIPLPCYLRCFQAPSCPLPCYLRCFQASVTMLFAVFSSAQMSVTMLFAVFSCAQMSVTMLFAVFSSAQMSVTMLIAVFSCAQMSVTMLFAVFSDAQGVRGVLRLYYKQSTFQPRKLRVSAAYSAYYVCATKVDFPATEAPRVRGVLHLYYKSRLSSHGSSGCPLRTTFVLQKSTFQPRKLRASPAYYVCTTKVDFPATEAPGVRGVLRLYYKTRLSSHGSSACPYYKSRLWHRDHAETRRGVTFVCQKTQKHEGFGTVPTPQPAEGLRLFVKKGQNTMVLAPRQRRNPQRVVCGHGKKFQKRRF